MSISRYKTFVDGQTLTAADLNGIQDAVVNNDQSVGSPRTAPFDLDGQRLIISGDGNTSLISTSAGKIDFRLNSADLFDLDGTAAASVNGFSVITSATGVAPILQAKGSDTNVGAVLAGKGTGSAVLRSNGVDILTADGSTASSVNAITVASAATGSSPQVKATGSDTDINLRLTPKGAGVVNVAAGQGYAVDGTTARTWKMVGSGTSLLFQENTGTPSVPVWTTRVEFQTISGIALPDPNNQLDNGALNVWQDGAVSGDIISGTPTFPDRWGVAGGVAGGHCTVSRQTLGANGFRYLQRIQRVAAASTTTVIQFYQAIPTDVAALLAGQQVTLSFYARAGANYSAASGALVSRIHTGTGSDEGSAAMIGFFAGPWAGDVQQDQSNTLTTTLQRFTQTVTLASNATEVGVELRFTPVGTAGAADYFEVTGLMLQLGPTASTYPHLPFQRELALCQRFYAKTFAYGTKPAVAGGFAGTIVQGRAAANPEPYQRWQFPVEMRVAPTITRWNPGTAGAATQWRDNGDANSTAAAQTLHVTTTSAIITNTTVTVSGASSWHLHLSADARL